MLESIVGVFAVLLLGAVAPAAALVGVAVPYAVLRMRDARGDYHDPQLGLKVAYHFFFSLGILLVLVGLTVNVADLIIDDKPAQRPQFGVVGMPMPVPANPKADGRLLTPNMRTGWALVSSGLLFAVVFGLSAQLGTNVRRFPAVRRVFVGWRLVAAGIAVVAAVTTLAVWLFMKDQPEKLYEIALATLAVWAPTLAVHVFLMQRYAKAEYYVPPKAKTPPRPVIEEDEDDED
jgi:hypothetical protein